MLRFHTQTGGLDAHRAAAAQQRRARRPSRRSPPCSAARSRCTRTRIDEALGAADRERRASSRCARSRSSPTRAGVADIVDPLAGSYYVEALTDEIEQRAREYIEDDRRAGRRGRARSSTASRSARSRRPRTTHQQAVEPSDAIVVGVNQFDSEERASRPTSLRIAPEVGERAGPSS